MTHHHRYLPYTNELAQQKQQISGSLCLIRGVDIDIAVDTSAECWVVAAYQSFYGQRIGQSSVKYFWYIQLFCKELDHVDCCSEGTASSLTRYLSTDTWWTLSVNMADLNQLIWQPTINRLLVTTHVSTPRCQLLCRSTKNIRRQPTVDDLLVILQ